MAWICDVAFDLLQVFCMCQFIEIVSLIVGIQMAILDDPSSTQEGQIMKSLALDYTGSIMARLYSIGLVIPTISQVKHICMCTAHN